MAKKQITYNSKIFDISYSITNQYQKDSVLFLHGWGSTKEIMQKSFEPYLNEFKHIYMDMPGFGKSPNNEVLNTDDYKNIVDIFINSLTLNTKKIVIVGHSFGGKVATKLSPKLLVLIGSSGIIEAKTFKTKLIITLSKILNTLGLANISKLFRSADVENMCENMYKTFKNIVDEDFEREFEKRKTKTLIFWGKNDNATALSSGQKIANLMINSKLIIFDGDHYFFTNYSKQISKKIEENFDKL